MVEKKYYWISALILVVVIGSSVSYFQVTGERDLCVDGEIWIQQNDTALYYCPSEDSYQYCSSLSGSNRSCYVMELIGNETVNSPETTRTSSTQTVCDDNGKCTLTLYSGVRYAYEDEIWKPVEEARSLKEAWDVVYLKDDGDHKIDVLDYNYTSITLDLSFIGNAEEYEYEVEEGKTKIKFKIIETKFNETSLESYEEEIEYEIEIEEDKKESFIYNKNPLGKKFKFGFNSTTIMLQEADTENLEDVYIHDRTGVCTGSGGQVGKAYTYIKFNISSIPSGQQIDDSKLCLYVFELNHDNDVVYYRINNQTWTEDDSVSSLWALSINNISTDSSAWPNDDAWDCINTTSQIEVDYDLSNDYASLRLHDPDNVGTPNTACPSHNMLTIGSEYVTGKYVDFRSKEYSTGSLRPYLNITYSPPPNPTVPQLNAPADDSTHAIIPQLNWSNSTDPQGDAIFYYLEVDGNLDFSSPEYVNTSITETTNTTGDTPTGLNIGVNYWRVLATDNSYNSSWSEIWKFTIKGITISSETKSPDTIYSYTDVIVNATIIITNTTLDTVWLGSDFNGSWVNYTVSTNVGDEYYYTIDSGNFSDGQVVNWIYYANNTGGIIETNGTLQSFTVGACQKWFVEDSNENYVFTVDMCTGETNVTGNVTAENVFLPAYISSHTNDTIPVASAGVWYNVTFDQEEAEFKRRITHTANDDTNITFTIVDTGMYEIIYSLTFEDSQATPLNHVITRVLHNNVEMEGFTIEADTTKQNADLLMHHSDLAELVAGDTINLQFTSDSTTVSLTSHLTYGGHQNTGHLTIKRIV